MQDEATYHHKPIFFTVFDRTDHIDGHLLEFGVLHGTTFELMVIEAMQRGVLAVAVDSFEGMDEPGPRDVYPDGLCEYPKGRFDVGGVKPLLQRMESAGYRLDTHYAVYKGFIPSILESIEPDWRYSLVHIDVDHYEPTLAAMNWAWPRLHPGGIMLCDDYFDWKTEHLASGAIHAWLRENTGYYLTDYDGRRLAIKKAD